MLYLQPFLILAVIASTIAYLISLRSARHRLRAPLEALQRNTEELQNVLAEWEAFNQRQEHFTEVSSIEKSIAVEQEWEYALLLKYSIGARLEMLTYQAESRTKDIKVNRLSGLYFQISSTHGPMIGEPVSNLFAATVLHADPYAQPAPV